MSHKGILDAPSGSHDPIAQQIEQHSRQQQGLEVFQKERQEPDTERGAEARDQEKRLHEERAVEPDPLSHQMKDGIVQPLPGRKDPAVAEEQEKNQEPFGSVYVSNPFLHYPLFVILQNYTKS